MKAKQIAAELNQCMDRLSFFDQETQKQAHNIVQKYLLVSINILLTKWLLLFKFISLTQINPLFYSLDEQSRCLNTMITIIGSTDNHIFLPLIYM